MPSSLPLLQRPKAAPGAAPRLAIGHPLLRNIERVWLFNGIGTPTDLVRGDAWQQTRSGSDIGPYPGPGGMAFQRGASGSSTQAFYATKTSGLQTNDPISVLVLYQGFGSNPNLESVPNTQIGANLFATRNASVGPNLYYSNGLGAFAFGADGAGLLKGASGTTSRTLGVWYHVGGSWDAQANSFSLYVNGQLEGRDNLNVAGSFSGAWGNETIRAATGASGSVGVSDKRIALIYYWRRCLSQQEFESLYVDPYQILESGGTRYHLITAPPASSGITGTIAVTLADVTSSISGTVTPPAVTGTISVTLADVTSSISGTASTDVTGTIASILDHVQPAISGSVANPPTESQLVLRSTLPVITSGAQLIVPAHQYAYARVTNLTGVTIYVGGADVTAANGFPIANNGSEQFELRMTDALYAVAASGSNNLNVLVQIH